MNWLLANPVADLSGPLFLLVYALVAAAIVVASRLQIAAADTSLQTQLPGVTMDRDPYEIAFLRGGANELLRFTIFDLTRLGFLRVCEPVGPRKSPDSMVATGAPGSESLSSLQREVIAYYAAPHTTAELFASKLPASAAAYGAATFAARLAAERMTTGPELAATATLVRLYGALALTAFAAYRFLTATLRHHNNVIFLAILTVVSLVILFVVTRVPRLSRRGDAYLQRLATAVAPERVAPVAAGVGVLPILVAATGLGALADTEYAPMTQLFPRRRSRSSGSCSGGCGSASSGGSGSSCSSGSCGGGGGCGG